MKYFRLFLFFILLGTTSAGKCCLLQAMPFATVTLTAQHQGKVIRSLDPASVLADPELEKQVIDQLINKTDNKRSLLQRENIVLRAITPEDNPREIWGVIVVEFQDHETSPALVFNALAVQDHAKKLGLGKVLLEEAIAYQEQLSKERGTRVIGYLEVLIRKEDVINLYRDHGFQIVDEIEDRYWIMIRP